MVFTLEEATKFVDAYEQGRFDTVVKTKSELEKSTGYEPQKKSLEDLYQRVIWELAHPTDKIEDDPNAVLVQMGYVGFTTSLSDSPRLKTIGLGSCLALVSSGKARLDLTNQMYTVGSLAHVASTLDLDCLMIEIVSKYLKQGILPQEIDYRIYATDTVDGTLLSEVKEKVKFWNGKKDVKEDIRSIHSRDMLYDFESKRAYEIASLDLSLPEYKKPIMIPPPYGSYIPVEDPRTEMSLRSLLSTFLGQNENIQEKGEVI